MNINILNEKDAIFVRPSTISDFLFIFFSEENENNEGCQFLRKKSVEDLIKIAVDILVMQQRLDFNFSHSLQTIKEKQRDVNEKMDLIKELGLKEILTISENSVAFRRNMRSLFEMLNIASQAALSPDLYEYFVLQDHGADFSDEYLNSSGNMLESILWALPFTSGAPLSKFRNRNVRMFITYTIPQPLHDEKTYLDFCKNAVDWCINESRNLYLQRVKKINVNQTHQFFNQNQIIEVLEHFLSLDFEKIRCPSNLSRLNMFYSPLRQVLGHYRKMKKQIYDKKGFANEETVKLISIYNVVVKTSVSLHKLNQSKRTLMKRFQLNSLDEFKINHLLISIMED